MIHQAGDSWHTQNIQINKIIGENEKRGFYFTEKEHTEFLANPIHEFTITMRLEYLVVPESKEVLKRWVTSKGYKSQPERAVNDQIWNNLNNQINILIVLDYNPKYKINIHEASDISKYLKKDMNGEYANLPCK